MSFYEFKNKKLTGDVLDELNVPSTVPQLWPARIIFSLLNCCFRYVVTSWTSSRTRSAHMVCKTAAGSFAKYVLPTLRWSQFTTVNSFSYSYWYRCKRGIKERGCRLIPFLRLLLQYKHIPQNFVFFRTQFFVGYAYFSSDCLFGAAKSRPIVYSINSLYTFSVVR